MIRRSMLKTRAREGQTIYQTMLAISCVMLALAIFFPVFEYFLLYRGAPKTDMFSGEAVSSPARPAATEAPAPAETPAPSDTSAPEPAGGGDEATD